MPVLQQQPERAFFVIRCGRLVGAHVLCGKPGEIDQGCVRGGGLVLTLSYSRRRNSNRQFVCSRLSAICLSLNKILVGIENVDRPKDVRDFSIDVVKQACQLFGGKKILFAELPLLIVLAFAFAEELESIT